MRIRPVKPNFERFRQELASKEALPQLTLLGLLSGLLTALVIMLFRELITLLSGIFMNGAPEGSFRSLPWEMRLLLPLAGSVLVIGLGYIIHTRYRRVGVVHVIERLDWHQGRLYFGNFLHQFLAGAVAIASGHAIGREGPAVHLGASAASMLGQRMHLPHNSLRILVACGTAAAISAAFNTPVAGVIFALEILLVEYTVAGFLPVMVASVSAATVTQMLYGTDPAFIIPRIQVDLIDELPTVVLIGVSMGVLAALFCRLTILFSHLGKKLTASFRLLLAALITGLLAIPAPAIMGVGYGTITDLLTGEHIPLFLTGVLICKLLASSASVGLGVPGGLIGPTLFLGAIGGALGASLLGMIPGIPPGSNDFHVLVGMGAMLGATLQAPLTALVTVVEMTRNSTLLFPALLAIVIASLIPPIVFKQSGIFEQVLEFWGFNRSNNPIHKVLRRIGVTTLMESNYTSVNRFLSFRELEVCENTDAQWLLVYNEQRPAATISVHSLKDYYAKTKADRNPQTHNEDTVDLLEIPALRHDVCGISYVSSVYEAWDRMISKQVDSLYIFDNSNKQKHRIIGVVTRAHLEAYHHV